MNKLVERKPLSLPAELENLARAAEQDAGFEAILKFVKTEYICNKQVVELGTEYTAHCLGYSKMWVKFVDKKPVERKVYRMGENFRVPERDEMPDNDRTQWPLGFDHQPSDPWSLQYVLPMQDVRSEQRVLFVTGSIGGKRAISDLVTTYTRKCIKTPGTGLPIIKLDRTTFPSTKWGNVQRPLFTIIGWEAGGGAIREVDVEDIKKHDEMDDEIPF